MTNAIAKKEPTPHATPKGSLPMADDFVDLEGKSQIPAATLANARIALHKMGVPCSQNLFTGKKYVGGTELNSDVGGQVSDESIGAIRVLIRDAFKFDPGKNHTWDAVNLYCRENAFHPIKDYLESFAWDGIRRIDTWMIDLLGAHDTPFVRATSRRVLVASVRRIYQPGCKFDYMTVLESPEGFNKSSMLSLLYGAENFSDQTILGLTDKELQEQVRGRWCIESADMTGMRKAEVEKVKAQMSRATDRARPAFGRAVLDIMRSTVFWGTTNDSVYLQSQTGNRRFLPITVGRIDLAAIASNRDQLWAEAKVAHEAGEEILLPKSVWAEATREQAARTLDDPWIDSLADAAQTALWAQRSIDEDYETETQRALRAQHLLDGEWASVGYGSPLPLFPLPVPARVHRIGEFGGLRPDGFQRTGPYECVTSRYLLETVLAIPDERRTAEHGKRVGRVMRHLGWQGPVLLPHGFCDPRVKGYRRYVGDILD
jgi:hypothetical protein